MENLAISPISAQLTELVSAYAGLSYAGNGQSCMTVKGRLVFEASSPGLEAITDSFDIEISIPATYPNELPVVKEVSGRIKEAWDHINPDGTLCLAVPMEQRKTFNAQPTLLGFTDNLVIPYLYGYCYWEKHNSYPFGEAKHGAEGILDYYKQLFSSKDGKSIVRGLYRAYRYGYRGHHPCPCGSRKTTRQCHKDTVWELTRQNLKQNLGSDLNIIITKLLH
ncbi:MAG: hypothetical protein V7752_13285 [Halopseudomonas sp.]